jgi:lipopolysaccharide heptosyltransferase I
LNPAGVTAQRQTGRRRHLRTPSHETPDARPWVPPQGRSARILIVRLSALGDVVHALPVLAALKRWNPGCQVDWAVDDRSVGLLEGHPDLERVVVFPRQALRGLKALVRGLGPLGAFARALRERTYDLALDLQGNLKSGFVARVSGAATVLGAARRHTREGNHLWLHRGVELPPHARHKVERNLALLAAALGEPVGYARPRPPFDAEDQRVAGEALTAAGLPAHGFEVLHPGTSGFGAFKRWPADRFAALARRLGSPAAPVALTFGPGERALAERIAVASEGAARCVSTPSLRSLAALLSRAARVIAGDTGPLHLAAALGTPVLGIYGPKDPEVYGPFGPRTDGSVGRLPVVVQPDVACRPCTVRRCAAPLCLTTLAPERVLAALEAAPGSGHDRDQAHS